MKRILLAALALLLPCAVAAAPLDRGTVELETGISLDHVGYSHSGESLATDTRLDGNVGLAYSLTRMFQVGGGLLFSAESYTPEGGSSLDWRSLGGSVDVTANFRAPNGLVPFVRLGIGAVGTAGNQFTDKKTSLWAPMVRAGVRFLVGDAGSINLSASYRHETNAAGFEGDTANRFGLAIGLSLFPIRGR